MSSGARSPLSSGSVRANSASGAKRKRSPVIETAATKGPKSKKRKRKSGHDRDDDLDVHRNLNLAIGKMESRLLADYMMQRTKRFAPGLSLVELQDRVLPGIE